MWAKKFKVYDTEEGRGHREIEDPQGNKTVEEVLREMLGDDKSKAKILLLLLRPNPRSLGEGTICRQLCPREIPSAIVALFEQSEAQSLLERFRLFVSDPQESTTVPPKLRRKETVAQALDTNPDEIRKASFEYWRGKERGLGQPAEVVLTRFSVNIKAGSKDNPLVLLHYLFIKKVEVENRKEIKITTDQDTFHFKSSSEENARLWQATMSNYIRINRESQIVSDLKAKIKESTRENVAQYLKVLSFDFQKLIEFGPTNQAVVGLLAKACGLKADDPLHLFLNALRESSKKDEELLKAANAFLKQQNVSLAGPKPALTSSAEDPFQEAKNFLDNIDSGASSLDFLSSSEKTDDSLLPSLNSSALPGRASFASHLAPEKRSEISQAVLVAAHAVKSKLTFEQVLCAFFRDNLN